MRINTAIFTCLLVSIVSFNVSANDLFDRANKAFTDGDYQQAADHFLALSNTDNSSEVYYNLAICYFKLKQWPQAKSLFSTLSDMYPNDTLIRYNLAITEKRTGQMAAAKQHFVVLSKQSDDKSIAKLASRQLKHLVNATNNNTNQSLNNWTFGSKVQYGSYDNLLTPSKELNTGVSDSVLESRAYFRWQDKQYSNNRWSVRGFIYQSDYKKTEAYNARFAKLGVRKYLPLEEGYWFVGGDVDTSRLNNTGYLRNISTEVGTVQRFTQATYWGASYQYRDITSLSTEFDAFDGKTQELNLSLGQQISPNMDWKIYYRFNLENRQDSNQGVFYFRSYSPQRHGVGGHWRYSHGDLKLSIHLDYRDSNYQKANVDFGTQKTLREDRSTKARIKLDWEMSPSWVLATEYGYIDNSSTINTYIYDQQIFKVGVAWEI